MRRGRLARACLLPALMAGAAACWTLGAGPAAAKSFFLAPAGPNAWLVIDPTSAESQPGGVVRRMWAVTVQRNIVDGGPAQPGYVRTQSDYDCQGGQVRWRTFSAYSRSGTLLVTRDNPNPSWTPASASDVYAAYRIACGGPVTSAVSAESIGRLVITLMAAWDPPEGPATAPQQPLLSTAAATPPTSAKTVPPAKGAPVAAKPPAAKPAAAKAPAVKPTLKGPLAVPPSK